MINRFKLFVGQTLDQEKLILELDAQHYRRREFVSRPGDYAIRGHVADIYPLTYQSPVRISFHLDRIESIHDFSVATGEILAHYAEVVILSLSSPFEKKLPGYEHALSARESVKSFLDIQEGDYVVHLDYGIGRFLGVKRLKVKGEWKKHLAIEYAGGELLYVESGPVSLIERYIGFEGRKPKLTKLHGRDWTRIKEKVRLAIHGVARDMLRIQAKRDLLKGFRFKPDIDWQKQFEDEFPYEETPDQIRAADEVKKDMESPKPMDRLLCGDVGYGKTEVAMRSAFKAVMSGKQVAFLVPTTILAEQHYLVLCERVKNFPVRVETLSRFRSPAEQKQIVDGLKSGGVDVVIGTHRLLSRDVEFKDLGLVIIDEEQRFGVRHKERLKELRTLVDVLTLTATPIPRTLYMALIGVRDMSVIATPPGGRLSVRTEVMGFDDNAIREAFDRELKRGGQVYFVHNRIETIDRVYRRLSALMPGIRLAVAHGQLSAGDLESIMKKFIRGEIDCLISTNIIESGLDIPNVNTIFVDRADTFGLSDLYQLRGRVGRFFERQAYAYFLVPKGFVMSGDAGKRIRAIERFTELGAGFKVAMEDLEIRGAGNILGEEQSGYIYQIGFDLYCRLLSQAVEEEKKRTLRR
ncbi:MAG TPA: transcription-repair coupling factor [Candidatus Omnitrophota bacterium]|nr:transcription-repair coupling factor [Candidatus Omnitrophota bacterium]